MSKQGHRGRMVVGLRTTYAIGAYPQYSIQHYVARRWFSLGSPVSSTNKTGYHI
jgi:hypothetical protein